jgi:hypothetical protein
MKYFCHACNEPKVVVSDSSLNDLVFSTCSGCGRHYYFTPAHVKNNRLTGHQTVSPIVHCHRCEQFFWPRQLLPEHGIARFQCKKCAAVLTADMDKLPIGDSPAADSASPDGSCAIFWHNADVVLIGTKRHVPKPVTPADSNFPDLKARVARLMELRDFDKITRDQLADDPFLLETYDALVERERHKVMMNEPEDDR